MAPRRPLTLLRNILLVLVAAALLLVAGVWYAARFIEPAPPSEITITTGSPNGAYFRFAQNYAKQLAQSHVTLKVQASPGSVENIKRLQDDKSGVSLALVQGGVANSRKAPDLRSLGRVFLEPVWVFYRGDATINRLNQLRGQRIAIGPEGSGTAQLAKILLTAVGLTADNTRLMPYGGEAAMRMLRQGAADAIFLVQAAESPLVEKLLKDDNIKLMNFSRAAALSRLYPFLTPVTLPEGTVDLARNIPDRTVTLLAAGAGLVVRDDFHPALISLLVKAAKETHSGAGIFQKPGQFPQARDPEYTMSKEAQRFYEKGDTFLKTYLPFWVASWLERSMVMIVPLATLLIPLFKFAPLAYTFGVRRRILRWYRLLKELELDISQDTANADLAAHETRLQELADGVNHMHVPVAFTDQLYELKSAIDLVQKRLTNRRNQALKPPGARS